MALAGRGSDPDEPPKGATHMKHQFNTRRTINLTDATARRSSEIGTDSYHMSHCTTRRYLGKNADLSCDDATPYYGAELEIECPTMNHEQAMNAAAIIRGSFSDKLAGIEHDGSLLQDDDCNDLSFELVSEPATLAYHMRHFGWADILGLLAEMGCSSHDSGRCGLHVHVSRSALGKNDDARDRVAAMLICLTDRWFTMDPASPLARFARRTPGTYCRRVSAGIEPNDSRAEMVRKAKATARTHDDRYHAINLTNRATIEFRLFRGTLRPETFAATLQLVDTMVHWCMQHTVRELQTVTFGDIVASCRYPELRAYCERRHIDLTTSDAAETAAAASLSREE